MSLQLLPQDITTLKVDAIVNAANSELRGGGGVDGCIHRKAGPKLAEACRKLGGCRTGQAVITPGYDLPCRYVIHTVGPIYQDGQHGEAELLASCYWQSLQLALAHNLQTVAFSLISAGAYGYPQAAAFKIALQAITAFLKEHEMTVYLTLMLPTIRTICGSLFPQLGPYVEKNRRPEDRFAGRHADRPASRNTERDTDSRTVRHADLSEIICQERRQSSGDDRLNDRLSVYCSLKAQPSNLRQAISHLDISFSDYLFKLIQSRHMTDVECYKKANLDRKLFSKIRSDLDYHPSKATALSLALALRLDLEETRSLLERAGLALSPAAKSDVIIQYFIQHQKYNIWDVNAALIAYEEKPL